LNGFVHGNLELYLRRLEQARSVWCLYPDDTEFLQDRGVQAHTWNYGPDVFGSDGSESGAEPPIFDFVHIGSGTPQRMSRIHSLEAMGYRVNHVFVCSNVEKVGHLLAARYSLALDYDGSYLPWPRIVYAKSKRRSTLTDHFVERTAPQVFGSEYCARPASWDRLTVEQALRTLDTERFEVRSTRQAFEALLSVM
jgi:hypothetical protein